MRAIGLQSFVALHTYLLLYCLTKTEFHFEYTVPWCFINGVQALELVWHSFVKSFTNSFSRSYAKHFFATASWTKLTVKNPPKYTAEVKPGILASPCFSTRPTWTGVRLPSNSHYLQPNCHCLIPSVRTQREAHVASVLPRKTSNDWRWIPSGVWRHPRAKGQQRSGMVWREQ